MIDSAEIDRDTSGRIFPPFDKGRLTNSTAALSHAGKTIQEALDSARLGEATSKLSTVGQTLAEALSRSDFAGLAKPFAFGEMPLGDIGSLSEQFGSIASVLGEGITGRLADLDTANAALREAKFNMGIDQGVISALESQLDLQRRLDETLLERYPDFPEMPPNPIFETNVLLEKLSSDFEDLKSVTAATADVQEKQAALVAQLLAASVEGSKAQQRAAAETLRIARISMWISLAAVMLTLLGVGAQALL